MPSAAAASCPALSASTPTAMPGRMLAALSMVLSSTRTTTTCPTSRYGCVKATPAGGVSGIIRADMTASKSRAEPAAMLFSTPSLGVTTNS